MYGNTQMPKPLMCDYNGSLNTRLSGPSSAFGDIRMVEPTPLTQFNFVYGFNNNYMSYTGTGTASGTGANSLGVITVGTGANAQATMNSKKYFKYRDGLGGMSRFTTVFGTGVAGNAQTAGLGDSTDGYFFGYTGTTFGILHRRFNTNTWIPQTTWNQDTMLGIGGNTNPSNLLLNPQRGNIYQILIAYLGFGNTRFSVYHPVLNEMVPVHTISWANANTGTNLSNPSMTLSWQSTNNASVLASPGPVMSVGSASIFIDGPDIDTGSKYGRSSLKTNPGTAEVNFLTIQNNTGINGYVNKAQLKLKTVSFFAIDSSLANNANTCTLNIYSNPLLAGGAFTNIDTNNSITAFDTTATFGATGAVLLQSMSSCYTSSVTVPLDQADIFASPGERLTCTMSLSASTAATRAGVSLNWTELT